jgi:cytochrome c oxidase subunit 1
VVAPGTIIALFAGIYYWFPKITGRTLSDTLGKIHFWGTIIFMNGIFMPMFIQGLAGVSRRLYDGGQIYQFAEPVLHYNQFMSISAWLLALAQIPFIVNLFLSWKRGREVNANPWDATTLEWSAAPSPPIAHGNFAVLPKVVRGPYEYSPPENPNGYLPQNEVPPVQPQVEVEV